MRSIFVPDAVKAAAAIAIATKLDLRYVGETHISPEQWGRSGRARPADVLVAWAEKPGDLGLRFGDQHVAGVGGAIAAGVGGRTVYVSGEIVLNPRSKLEPGFGSPGVGGVLLHEWGHVVGLAHVHKSTEVMDAASTMSRLGEGDRRGLRVLGRASGCVSTP